MDTTFSFGALAGQVLSWMAVVIAPVIATLLGNWLVKLAAKVKVDIKDADRARIQEIVENGIKWGAAKLNILLNGSVTPANKAAIIKAVVTEYLPEKGAETVKALGGDVTDAKAMTDIVTARAADILAIPAEVRAVAKAAGDAVAPVVAAMKAMKP